MAGMMPAGAKPWNGLMSKHSVKFERRNLCISMFASSFNGYGWGHSGGRSKVNEIKAIAEKKKSLFVTNKDRLNNYLQPKITNFRP